MTSLAKLKIDISPIIIEYIAEENGMDVGEYGQVYDAEGYEEMLNRIVNEVLYFKKKERL